MKTMMARKPYITLLKPFSMLSAPRLGPMVRSWMISMGAASEPARSSSARSLASTTVIEPDTWKRLPSSPLIDGAVSTSPLPFSKISMAMRFL
jgi:hypothetical protein